MLELSTISAALGRFSFIYWLLAIAVIGLAVWKGRRGWGRTVLTLGAIVVFGFLPAKATVEQVRSDAYAREAWAYFKKKCETEAGEKIYKTYTDVKSVLVIKPLPPASDKDNYDQFWYGDPYSATPTSVRARAAASILTLWSRRPTGIIQEGLEFVEMKGDSGVGFLRIMRPVANDKNSEVLIIEKPISRFGISWEDISTPHDRKYWIAGSRLSVVDLVDGAVVAERIGYLIESGFGRTPGGRAPWAAARGLGRSGRSCPDAHDYSDSWFITNVFKQDGKQ